MKGRHERATVLIADDHTVVAEGLAESLRPHFTVVGQVTHLDQLLDAIRKSRPDVVVLDLSFQGVSSLPILKAATADRKIEARFVVLTAYGSKALASAALRAGALSFLLKGVSTHELRLAIEAAIEGRGYSAGESAADLSPGSPYGGTVRVAGVALRRRQLQLLTMLLDGLDRDAIAETLELSRKGVDYHLSTTRDVVGTPNIRLLMLWATEHEVELRLALKGKDDAARLLPKRR